MGLGIGRKHVHRIRTTFGISHNVQGIAVMVRGLQHLVSQHARVVLTPAPTVDPGNLQLIAIQHQFSRGVHEGRYQLGDTVRQ